MDDNDDYFDDDLTIITPPPVKKEKELDNEKDYKQEKEDNIKRDEELYKLIDTIKSLEEELKNTHKKFEEFKSKQDSRIKMIQDGYLEKIGRLNAIIEAKDTEIKNLTRLINTFKTEKVTDRNTEDTVEDLKLKLLTGKLFE